MSQALLLEPQARRKVEVQPHAPTATVEERASVRLATGSIWTSSPQDRSDPWFKSPQDSSSERGAPVRYRSAAQPPSSRWYSEFADRLKKISQLSGNWNTYGAAAPSRYALFWAEEVLRNLDHAPESLRPMADGGVSFRFWRDGRFATIECAEDGSIAAGTVDRVSGLRSYWDVGSGEDALSETLAEISQFLL